MNTYRLHPFGELNRALEFKKRPLNKTSPVENQRNLQNFSISRKYFAIRITFLPFDYRIYVCTVS